jgi:hypothetical protein
MVDIQPESGGFSTSILCAQESNAEIVAGARGGMETNRQANDDRGLAEARPSEIRGIRVIRGYVFPFQSRERFLLTRYLEQYLDLFGAFGICFRLRE